MLNITHNIYSNVHNIDERNVQIFNPMVIPSQSAPKV